MADTRLQIDIILNAQKAIKGAQNLEKGLSGLNNALKGVDNSTSSNEKKTRSLSRSTVLLGGASKKLASELKILRANTSTTEKEFNDLGNSLKRTQSLLQSAAPRY